MVGKDKWGRLIRDWNEKELPRTVDREAEIPEPKVNRAVILIGPRRAGKTYCMFIAIKGLSKSVGREKLLYINLERADLGLLDYSDLNRMLETYREIYPGTRDGELRLFLDEIQNVKGWERFVRSCLDDGIKVFLTGSSSKLLSKEIATEMAGRSLSYAILPFSFREYLRARGMEVRKYYSTNEEALVKKSLAEYVEWGGYPEAILYPEERERIIRDIFDTAILKDIEGRYKIRNTALLKAFVKALLTAKEFSINKFYNYTKGLGISVGKNTLYNYLEYLEEAFIVVAVRKFGRSYKKPGQSLPKIYFIDNGLLTANGIEDRGRLVENIVLTELVRKGKEVGYWKNSQGEEVDFVVVSRRKAGQLIQVSYDMSSPDTRAREVKALLKASEELRCNDLLIITMGEEGLEKAKGKAIKIVPLWKWLLRPIEKSS